MSKKVIVAVALLLIFSVISGCAAFGFTRESGQEEDASSAGTDAAASDSAYDDTDGS